jgi:hypothetical protein
MLNYRIYRKSGWKKSKKRINSIDVDRYVCYNTFCDLGWRTSVFVLLRCSAAIGRNDVQEHLLEGVENDA